MIYLIRHGQTDWNLNRKLQGQTDIPLNQNGRNQAEQVSEEVSKLKIDKIISSDLLRAKETAEIINKKVGAKITYDKRIREINYGDHEGKYLKVLNDEDCNMFNYYPEKIHSETRKQVYDRVKSFLREIKDDGNVLIVTHGGIMKMMLYYANNRENFDMETYSNFSLRYFINNTKIIEYKEKGK